MAQVLSPFSVSRMPPQQIEAEISLLGSLLLDGSMMDRIVDILGADDFYKPEHRIVFDSMLSLFEKQRPIDILSVSNALKDVKKLEDIGGQSCLTNLVNSVPTASNAAYYAEIIKKKKVLRDLISVSHDISQLGYQEDTDIDALLDDAEQKVFRIAHKSLIKGFTPVSASLEEAWERIDKLHNNPGDGSLRGVPTGFKELDNILSGLQKSDLIILAARPSLGKTTLAMDIARHAAMREKIPTGIFSLEMSIDQITDRLIAA